MTGVVAFLESKRYLLVSRMSVCAACRNHKREIFVPKSQIPVILQMYTVRRRLGVMMARFFAEAWVRVAFLEGFL